MGFNVSGILVNQALALTEVESILESSLSFSEKVSFEDATSLDREERTVDVFQSPSGTLAFFGFLDDDLHKFPDHCEAIFFIASDTSDTYVLKYYSKGVLQQQYIASQGEIIEQDGEGILLEDHDFMEVIWSYADQYLKTNFTNEMFDRYIMS